MTNLKEALTAPQTKPAVVADLATLIDRQVGTLGGLSGIAIKTAFGAAKRKDPAVVTKAANAYAGELGEVLQPLWDRFTASGGSDFGSFLSANKGEAETAIMTAVENGAPASGPERAMFDRFKPQVTKLLTSALPELGQIIQKHAN